jgi:hypothetical protein
MAAPQPQETGAAARNGELCNESMHPSHIHNMFGSVISVWIFNKLLHCATADTQAASQHATEHCLMDIGRKRTKDCKKLEIGEKVKCKKVTSNPG